MCEKLAADEKLAVCDGNAESRMRHISLSSYLSTFQSFFVKEFFVNKVETIPDEDENDPRINNLIPA